jgi:monoamine oxidase
MPNFQAPPNAVIVVGAGLAGMLSAYLLEQQGQSVLLIESRHRVGGRVLSDAAHTAAPFVDLGPSWLWPSLNERLSHWAQALNLTLFPQYQQGATVVEMPNHDIRRYAATFGQEPESQRLAGGAVALVHALMVRLKRTQLLLNTAVTHIGHQAEGGVALTVEGPQGVQQWHGAAVIVTLPPRLLAHRICWAPELPASLTAQWQRAPTWMAGQAKLVAAYPTPFWRDAGLSGDASSRVGPLVEIHDASDASGQSAALFGFVGVPAHWRAKMGEAELVARCLQQLARLFGPQAAQPAWVQLKDWAQDPHTATPDDALPVNSHPVAQPKDLPAPWDGRAFLAGSEFSDDFSGYLEGAVRSAEAAVKAWRAQALAGLNPF